MPSNLLSTTALRSGVVSVPKMVSFGEVAFVLGYRWEADGTIGEIGVWRGITFTKGPR